MPELTLRDKKRFLNESIQLNWLLSDEASTKDEECFTVQCFYAQSWINIIVWLLRGLTSILRREIPSHACAYSEQMSLLLVLALIFPPSSSRLGRETFNSNLMQVHMWGEATDKLVFVQAFKFPLSQQWSDMMFPKVV